MSDDESTVGGDAVEDADGPGRVAVTGTPGTGKTTATEHLGDVLDRDLTVVHLNDLVRGEDLVAETDEERDTLVVDLDAVRDVLGDWSGVVESHLAHHLDADAVVVLRCDPTVLEERLLDRGESEAKAQENAESEALDVILSEAVDRHGLDSVYEVDTTEKSPEAVAEAIAAVIRGNAEPSAGEVDFTGYF